MYITGYYIHIMSNYKFNLNPKILELNIINNKIYFIIYIECNRLL